MNNVIEDFFEQMSEKYNLASHRTITSLEPQTSDTNSQSVISVGEDKTQNESQKDALAKPKKQRKRKNRRKHSKRN